MGFIELTERIETGAAKMRFGGLGEFGMHMMALRYGDDIIVIDAGMMFPEDELLGVDIVRTAVPPDDAS